MASTQYSVNDKGEKVIAASKRADGTVRKERRVRPGFLPQDEVPVYVPRHLRVRWLPASRACRRHRRCIAHRSLTLSLTGTESRRF
jgi:hypothetical protein